MARLNRAERSRPLGSPDRNGAGGYIKAFSYF